MRRILLVGTARFEPDAGEDEDDVTGAASEIRGPLSDLAEKPWPLGALSEGEVAIAASGALGEGSLSGDLVRTLHHEAQGLPGNLVRILELYVDARASPDEGARRRLHDVAAAYFETRLTQRADLISAAATHALRGGEPERGIRLGLAAAAQAERLFAYDQAATFYAGVLEFLDILGRDAEKSVVRERLGDVHFRAGNWRKAISAYHFLLKELGTKPGESDAETRRRTALLTFKVGMIRLRRGDADAARTLFDRAEVELAKDGTSEERARLLDASARAKLDRADHDDAEAKARAGLALGGEDGPDDRKSLLNCTLGSVAFQRGDWKEAEARLQKAAGEGRRSGRPELARRALSALATTYWKTGRWDESEKIERECLAEAEHSRDLWA